MFEITKQKGAVYSITAAEDIVTPDGTVRVKKGTVVDTVTTDGKGTATSKALYLGKYTVKEYKAPAGMVISDEIHTVELAYAGQEISVTDSATSFYNERQKANITLAKVMERNEAFEIGDNSEILNVTFGLFAESRSYPLMKTVTLPLQPIFRSANIMSRSLLLTSIISLTMNATALSLPTAVRPSRQLKSRQTTMSRSLTS